MNILLKDLNHRYSKNKLALSSIELDLGTGVTGLLGANGAGKSTLLNIIATVFKPTEGVYQIDGIDALRNPNEVREVLGFLPQNFGYIPEFSPQEFLNYMGLLKGYSKKMLKDNIEELLSYFNLMDVRKVPMKNFSGGMRQRVGIAQALLSKPKLLILDEPMVGLDPNERSSFIQLVTKLATDSLIIISSHIIDDIENLCNNVVIMENGRIKTSRTITDLLSQTNGAVYEVLLNTEELTRLQADDHYQVVRTKFQGDKVKVRYVSTNGKFQDSEIALPQLEDAFILATQNKAS